MLSLQDREWKDYSFPDIFAIQKGFYNKKPPESDEGTFPFLGATESNNGITSFHTLRDIENASKIGYGENESLEKKIFKGNCIAVTNNGSVGHAYYQKSEFTCSHDINPLYLKNYKLNSYIAKFLIACIEKQAVCFEYARKWRPIRMVKSRIMLPISSDGKPDYAFMEQYIKERERQIIQNYIAYIGENAQNGGGQ